MMQDKPQSWEAQERGDAGRPEKDTSEVHEEPEECDVLEEKKKIKETVSLRRKESKTL